MTTTVEMRVTRLRVAPPSWGLWAERAVIRALDIDPDSFIREGLLCGQSTSNVALMIARSIGYLTGTQAAPDVCAPIREWLDRVGMVECAQRGSRLGGLSWAEWAERASLVAMEIDPRIKVQSVLLYGQFVWEAAITISRSVAFLAGARKLSGLPLELHDWLQTSPKLGTADEINANEEKAR